MSQKKTSTQTVRISNAKVEKAQSQFTTNSQQPFLSQTSLSKSLPTTPRKVLKTKVVDIELLKAEIFDIVDDDVTLNAFVRDQVSMVTHATLCHRNKEGWKQERR